MCITHKCCQNWSPTSCLGELYYISSFFICYNRSAYRKKRITASNFGLVLGAVKRKRYLPSLFKTLLGQYNLKQSSNVSYGVIII